MPNSIQDAEGTEYFIKKRDMTNPFAIAKQFKEDKHLFVDSLNSSDMKSYFVADHQIEDELDDKDDNYEENKEEFSKTESEGTESEDYEGDS